MKVSKRGAAALRTVYAEALRNAGKIGGVPLANASMLDLIRCLTDQHLSIRIVASRGSQEQICSNRVLVADRVQAADERERFWALRAKEYSQLQWANDSGYLQAILAAGDFASHHRVLDVGAGTGKVMHAVAPRVATVLGIDISASMLDQARVGAQPNEEFLIADICDSNLPSDYFDRITARMVFHHLVGKVGMAAHNCFRVLRPGGKLIVAEGVPPDPSLRDWYSRMFALKEDRITFMESDLVDLLRDVGFADIETHVHVSRQVSIRRWLSASGLPAHTQTQILQMHFQLDETARRFYNATVLDGDMYVDFKNAIVVGRKPGL